MSCSVVAVLSNGDNNATVFIRKKYSTAYIKHIKNCGIDDTADKNLYLFVRNGEFRRFGKDDTFDISCTCYICEKRGVKFSEQTDSMSSWLDNDENTED